MAKGLPMDVSGMAKGQVRNSQGTVKRKPRQGLAKRHPRQGMAKGQKRLGNGEKNCLKH